MRSRVSAVYGAMLCLGLCAMLFSAVRELPREARGLTAAVNARMAESGVEHPVTAVLLNFRGYDTWLELGVLLLAVLGALLFQPGVDLTRVRELPPAEPVLRNATKLLLPLAVLSSGYLVWVGKYAAGGAFQAGVLLGASLILMWLAGARRLEILRGTFLHAVLTLGFVLFMVVTLVLLAAGHGWLTFPPAQAGNLILLLETAATVSIACTLLALLLGQQAPTSGPEEAE